MLVAGREKRRARLFERHCEGARLNSDERAEIADLITAADKGARANDLTLEPAAPVALNRRTGLANPLQHYADLLNVGLRTVKRWLADGVKARDACPLDDLPKFAAWHKRTHPDRTLEVRVALSIEQVIAAAAAKSTQPAPAGAQVVNADSIPPAEGKEGEPLAPTAAEVKARPSIILGDIAAITLDENLRRLNSIHSANMQLLERSFREGSQSEVDARQRNVERSAKMLLDAQTALDEHLKARGDLMPREEIKRELLRVHSAMAASLVGQLVQLGIMRERATSVADSWFGHLRQSHFAATTAPELRPPVSAAA